MGVCPRSDLSVSNTSNAAEAPKGQTSMFGSSGPETSTTATTSLSSTFSLAKFGAPGAGAMSGSNEFSCFMFSTCILVHQDLFLINVFNSFTGYCAVIFRMYMPYTLITYSWFT